MLLRHLLFGEFLAICLLFQNVLRTKYPTVRSVFMQAVSLAQTLTTLMPIMYIYIYDELFMNCLSTLIVKFKFIV